MNQQDFLPEPETTLVNISACGYQSTPHVLAEVDPDSIEGQKIVHHVEHDLLKKLFEKISEMEGREYVFSYRLLSNGKIQKFMVTQETAESLGLSKNVFEYSYLETYPKVLGELQIYLNTILS